MLIPWILGLIGVIWYAATRRSVPRRAGLVALSIPIYLVAGVVVYIAVILIVVGLSRASTDPNGLLLLIALLKLGALGGEIAISIAVLRWLVRRKTMRSETAPEATKTADTEG